MKVGTISCHYLYNNGKCFNLLMGHCKFWYNVTLIETNGHNNPANMSSILPLFNSILTLYI